ncbi:MAG TPA: DUF3300 domain-containing protein [Candidatus Saccharimonadales bacterium]|nr:DUF3300 domain-containing protein [Candidatus Saccharimonadales bacterium]
MKRIVFLTAGLLAALSPVSRVSAQVAPPVYAATLQPRSAEQLDALLGPIALYPDPLIAEILPAATIPSQITMANRYVRQGLGLAVIDQQPWDASVKALARYPDLLQWMDTNLGWTTDVGQTFVYQQVEVMNSIQRLRGAALALGNLQSTPQQTVCNNNGQIEIVPANPQVVYVPTYQPQVVYVQRAPRPGLFVSFGIGVAAGSWLHHDLDWRDHSVIEWRNDHRRPSDWWSRRPEDRGHVTVVNNHVTVVNNRNERVASVWRPGNRDQHVAVRRVEPARDLRTFHAPAQPVRPAVVVPHNAPLVRHEVVRAPQPVRHDAPVVTRPAQPVHYNAPGSRPATVNTTARDKRQFPNQIGDRGQSNARPGERKGIS